MSGNVTPSDPALRCAYACAARIINERARSFAFAARFLPPEQRRDVAMLYAFCRTVDDIADLPASDASLHDTSAQLNRWRAWLDAGAPFAADPIQYGLAHVIRAHDLPLTPLRELLDGLRGDLEPRQLPDAAALDRYCYCVAGTVGIVMAALLGAHEPAARDHARDLGIAMQLTNVLRDVGEDLARGRIYLPADEMARRGYRRSDLERGIVDERFVALLQAYIARARRLYRQGLLGLRFLPRTSRLPIAVAAHTYAGILSKIEQAGYDVFTRRVHTGRREKLLLAARLSLYQHVGGASDAHERHPISFIRREIRDTSGRGHPSGREP
jgi:phytoene synthase